VIESRAMFCPKCGKQNDDRALYCQHCGVGFESKPKTPSSDAVAGSYAGFWTRFVAWLIDWIIILAAGGLIAAITFGTGVVVVLLGPWLYEAFMLSSEWQATVGKRAMSIAVTGLDGQRITFARATGRHFAKLVSGPLLLGIGFIMAAFTARKQALHDMMAETLVINK
jgi:uncharacterized RDD family membrane protein YckC